MYLQSYTTIEAVLRQNEKAKAASADSVVTANYTDLIDYLNDIIPQASGLIQSLCGTSFAPYKQTKTYYFSDLRESGAWVSNRGRATLYLSDFLLVTSSVTFDDTMLDSTDFRERPALPYYMIDFNPESSNWQWGNSFNDSIDINGTWCYHTSLSQAYTDVVADNSVTINDSATTLTVADVGAYETLQYIRIEDELLQITARDTSGGTDLTVQRGVNGSTAASHTGQQVEIFNVMPDLQMAATRLAGFFYENRVSYNVVSVGDASVIFERLPNEVKTTLNRYSHIASTALQYNAE